VHTRVGERAELHVPPGASQLVGRAVVAQRRGRPLGVDQLHQLRVYQRVRRLACAANPCEVKGAQRELEGGL
jgi:hypothetical protein